MRRVRAALAAAFTLAAAVSCAAHGAGGPKDGKPMSKQEHRWEVWDQQTLILELSDTPGTVTGAGGQAAPNPLLTAKVRSAAHEERLQPLLASAASVPELVASLISEGYRVKLVTPLRRWKVYDKDQLILEVSDVPGPIVDVTAPPPPGGKLRFHSFLSASAYSAIHGDQMHTLLQESKDTDDFVERLKKAGFRVEPVKD